MYDEKDLEADIKRFAVEVADDGRSASGRLLFGADVDGTLHYDFALRLPTLADQMAAEERGLAPLAENRCCFAHFHFLRYSWQVP